MMVSGVNSYMDVMVAEAETEAEAENKYYGHWQNPLVTRQAVGPAEELEEQEQEEQGDQEASEQYPTLSHVRVYFHS
jgi:hypothetical protein